ncbi:MAG: Na+/H+ antiporter subunit E [Labilithrix sp.]|nr:Na+/H+ antiporter subunit E [Labilithrix sp.]
MLRRLVDGRYLRAALRRGVAFACGWWALTEGDSASLAFGVPVLGAATFASLTLGPPERATWRVQVVAIARLVAFFLVGSARGGWDVARRAMSPRLPLSPVILRHPTRLTGAARTIFTSINALMPGTLSVGGTEEDVLIHALVDRGEASRRELELLEHHVARAVRARADEDGALHA